MSKSKHGFFMGAMAEHGILKEYLDENCATTNYKICAYKDSLPERAYQFVWDENSPFYKLGGWKETKTEFNEIINSTFTQPKYIMIHIRESIKATGIQLISFDAGEGNGAFGKGTELYERIEKYLPNDIQSYETAKQNKNNLKTLSTWNLIFLIVIVMSVLIILALLIKKKNLLSDNLKGLLFIFISALIVNAWSCGTFANAIHRLGCKIIWILPLLALILLCRSFSAKNPFIKTNF
ncbi:MAG: hypothetical protein M3R27_14275 [Bacteroidota bacterium]|nr:hypothetical protein [Bacteroidota bacterium]